MSSALVDVELVSLPLLVFNDGRLRTANAGARVLLGLMDSNLETYSYEALFPPEIAGSPETNKLKHEGHLEILRARVQSSQELLKLKAAVYTSQSDGLLRSILIVDVSVLINPPPQSIHGPLHGLHHHTREQSGQPQMGSRRQSAQSKKELREAAAAGHSPVGDPSISGNNALYRTTSTGSGDGHASQPLTAISHSLPSVIKRHSGDIRKIFGVERKKSYAPSQQAQAPQPLQPHAFLHGIRAGDVNNSAAAGSSSTPASPLRQTQTRDNSPAGSPISPARRFRAPSDATGPTPQTQHQSPLSSHPSTFTSPPRPIRTRSTSGAGIASSPMSSAASGSSDASTAFPPGFSAAISAMEKSQAEGAASGMMTSIDSASLDSSSAGAAQQWPDVLSPQAPVPLDSPKLSLAETVKSYFESKQPSDRNKADATSQRPPQRSRGESDTSATTPMPFNTIKRLGSPIVPRPPVRIDSGSPPLSPVPTGLSATSGSQSGSTSATSGSSTKPAAESGSAVGPGTLSTNNSSSSSAPSGVLSSSDGRASSLRSGANSDIRRSTALLLERDEASSGLAQSALSAHPRTGVIISRSDLSGGFINSKTRELLMGIKSPTGEISDPFDDNWSAPRAAGSKHRHRSSMQSVERSSSGALPRSGLAESHIADGDNDHGSAIDDIPESPSWEDELDFYYGEDHIRIDLPNRGQNLRTTIADILRWSLRKRRFLQQNRLLRDDVSIKSAKSFSPTPSLSGLGSPGVLSQRQFSSPAHGVAASAGADTDNESTAEGPPSTATAAPAITAVPAKSTPWIARKPYKVYDSSFSQRVEDPLEQMFDMVVRKGVSPPDNAIVVGIETEVGSAESCGFPESECFTLMAEPVEVDKTRELVPTRVRRRLLQVRAAVLRDGNGDHTGGVVWLRDTTGESAPPPTVPVGEPGKESATKITSPTGSIVTPGFQGPGTGLGNSDPFWQQIINSMPQMVWVTKPDGQHIYFNNKWYAYTGLQPEQSLGVNWQNPFHPDDMPASRRAWSRSLATGEPYSVEYRARRHDGVWRWQLGRAQALFDAQGKIVAWFGTCTDVEEFVKLREQLADTSRNLRRVIDLANITLICIDRDLKVTLMEGCGWSRRDLPTTSLIGLHLSELIDSPELIQHATEVINGSESSRLSVQNKSGNWIGCELTPLRVADNEAPQGVVIVSRDITNLKSAEAALKQSYQEQSRLVASETAAKEASRLKSEFTANLSHEIRTPITGMIGMSELLLEEEMTPAQHDSVRKILKSGEILLKMVGDVLDIGKVEAGKLELDIQAFVLGDLVSDATTMFRTAAAKKGLKFNEERSNLYEGEIMGDMPRMRQVLLNFLANSVKFTKQGFITLKVQQDYETEEMVQIRFEVQDSGIGIAKSVVPILFQPFQQADTTTSREHGGTGLGLAISKRLVALMNGEVTLDSDLGKGTKITVTVPFQKNLRPPAGLLRRDSQRTRSSESARLASDTKAQVHTAVSPVLPAGNLPATDGKSPPYNRNTPIDAVLATELDRSKIWILLAEDNPLNQEIFVKGIQRMGFNVKAANNGKEALDALQERKWDLILMDWMMPVMDGATATKLIRESDVPHIRTSTIIALTASAVAGDRERCLAAGMDGYLSKPVRLKILEETLVKYLVQDIQRARRQE